jgi:hypothetical protein
MSVCAQTFDQRPDVTTLRLNIQSRTIGVLLRRQAEHEQEIAALRRQIAELQHGRIASQTAHNALVLAVEQLEQRP